MKRLRNILKGLSLTSALFVFQACYGTPMPKVEPMDEEVVTVVEEGEEIPEDVPETEDSAQP